ncbi:MAG: hypothetical protein JXR07_19390 [Reichenbachiella sp.]
MRTKKLLMPALSLLVIASLIFVSCDEDSDPPVAPEISIDPETFTGAPGETVEATVSGSLDGDLVSLTITKYNGTTIDTSYGTDGSMIVTSPLPYDFSFTLGAEGLDGTAVRFGFVVVDENELTDETNLIITTTATRTQLLTFFNWRYASLLWQENPPDFVEGINECEEDNILTFNADGTMEYDFGAKTRPEFEQGSCAGDGDLIWSTWAFNAAEDTLKAFRLNAESELPHDTVVWAITEFSPSYWRGISEPIPGWGLFDYGHEAVAKD